MDPVIKGTSAAAEHTESRERIKWPKNSIFRAPAHIRSGREYRFEPKLVSIGPYYHGREDLKRMEDLKLCCIPEIPAKQATGVRNPRRYIYNVPVGPSMKVPPRGITDVPLEQFMYLGKKARAYYNDELDLSDDQFILMLVLDSCFVIRTILSLSQPVVYESMAFLDVQIKKIRSDLLLLENQIPLFFIMEVYEWLFPVNSNKPFPRFNNVLEPFIWLDMPWRINHDAMKSSKDAAHLLDLYWRCSLSPRMYMTLWEQEKDFSEEQPSSEEIHLSINAPMVIANATELQKTAGIEFENFKDKGHLDVIFSKGIMRMPCLKIGSRQITLLTNLIAFENCILPKMRIISCYMKLMDALIDSEQDVTLLQKCGVINNTLSGHLNNTLSRHLNIPEQDMMLLQKYGVINNAVSSEEKAATFFNDIGNFCFIDDNANHFSYLYKNVQKYYDSSSNRRWASLRQKYLRNPWAGITAIGAHILLILTVIQTFYAIYGYHNPKK